MENKFEFTPKQWVLVRNDVDDEWQLAIFSHLTKKPRYTQFRCFFATTGSVFYEHCIPYNEETKHLLGTTDAYEEPYEPKEGDFVTFFDSGDLKWVSIYKGIDAEKLITFADYDSDGNDFYISSHWGYVEQIRNREISPATKEEKKMLLDALHKQGKDWHAGKKEIVDYKPPYEPEEGDFIAFGEDETKLNIGIFKKKRISKDSFGKIISVAHDDFCDLYNKNDLYLPNEDFSTNTECWVYDNFRLATEEEKQTLLNALHEKGKNWDSEKKEIVDYEPPYEPKRGDFVKVRNADVDYIAIYHGREFALGKEHGFVAFAVFNTQTKELIYDKWIGSNKKSPATKEEKQMFLDKIHEQGKDWDSEKKKIVDYKWKPKKHDIYYRPRLNESTGLFYPLDDEWREWEIDVFVYNKGWVFKTKEECQALCDKLNEAIKDVK